MTTAVRTKIIDGDGHVWEDKDLAGHLKPPYENPRQLFPPLDHLHSEPLQYLPGSLEQAGPPEWGHFLEDVGIESTVLYPTWGLGFGNVFNRDWAIALARAYNDWLHRSYLQANPRFKGMALIPMQDPEAAVDELRRAVTDLGMLGALIPSNGLKGNLGAKEYWPVYAEAERLGCALAIHGAIHHRLGLDHLETYAPVHALGHPFGQMRACGSIIFNGIFQKFPGVRIGFLEGGVAWLLVCLERFDRSYETHIPYNPRGELLTLRDGERVSDHLRQVIDEGRFFVGCEGEEPSIAYAVQAVGNKPFIFSTDYPHEVNADMCKHEIGEIREHAGLRDEDKEAILSRNAQRFYKL